MAATDIGTSGTAARQRALVSILWVMGVLTPSGCRHPAADEAVKSRELPVARVGRRVITLGELEQRLNEQSIFDRAKYRSEAAKQEFLEGLVRSELLTEEALRRGYDRDPEVIKAYRQQLAIKLVKDELMDRHPAPPTSSEVETYYREHQDEFGQQRQLRAQQVVVADEATAGRVAEAAKRLSAADSAGFEALVAKYTIDKSTKKRGGDLGFMSAGAEVRRPLLDAVLALKTVGEIGGPVAVDGTFHVLRLAEVREALTTPLAQAETAVRRKLAQKAQARAAEQLMASLRTTIDVKLYPDTARQAQVRTSSSTAPLSTLGPLAPLSAAASPSGEGPLARTAEVPGPPAVGYSH